MLLDLYDDVIDDDDSAALSRTQNTTLLRRQDSEPVAEIYLANRSHSMSSPPVHRSHSYNDNISSAVDTAMTSTSTLTLTLTSSTLSQAGGRSEVQHSRPRSASALTRPSLPSTVEGQSTSQESSVTAPASQTDRRTSEDNGGSSRTRLPGIPLPGVPLPGIPLPGLPLPPASEMTDRRTSEDSASDVDTDNGGGSRSRLNQRRAVRAERRYHTADTIHDIDARSAQNNDIHKRLSLNYGGAAASTESSLRPPESAALSCESLGSFPSSSGVSSTASLYRANDDDTSLEVEQSSNDTKLSSPNDRLRDLTTEQPSVCIFPMCKLN